MTANKWTFCTDDAEFSLIHIKSADVLEGRLSHANSINSEHDAGDRTVLDDSWPRDAAKSVPIHVMQVESKDAWKSKYSALEVSVDIPHAEGDGGLAQSPRLDTLASDAISHKRTIVGSNTDLYVIHATMDTAALSNNMLGMSLPLIAYVNPKVDAGCQLPPFTLVGEVIVREILGMETALKDNLVLVTLTNRDVRQDVEVEDVLLSGAIYRKPERIPQTIPRENVTNVFIKTEHSKASMMNDGVTLLVKWHVKDQPLGVRSIWSTLTVSDEGCFSH